MARADLTIMGGGILGLTCAFTAARQGAKVAVYEQTAIGAGASGGFVGALAPHSPENWNPKKQFQLESLLMAEAFWDDVVQISGQSAGYARTGRVQAIADEKALAHAHARSATAQTLWPQGMTWRVISDPPAFAPHSPTGYFIHDTLSARLHPRMAARALVAAITALGGEVIIGTPEHICTPVIWATGYSGLQQINAALGQKIGSGVKGQALLLRHNAPNMPQLYADGLHIVPHEDGTIAVGSTSENTWDDPQSIDTQLTELHARACMFCPAIKHAEVIERWAGIRPRATSRAPIVDHWPERKGHFILNGGFKIGFGMAPKLAQVMLDLIAGKQADYGFNLPFNGK